jgi:hypothetical protein
MAKFNVIVNPFTGIAYVSSKVGNTQQEIEIVVETLLDEWSSFEFGDKVYDIHFYYDTEFSVSIYDADDIQSSHSVKLNIVLKDA